MISHRRKRNFRCWRLGLTKADALRPLKWTQCVYVWGLLRLILPKCHTWAPFLPASGWYFSGWSHLDLRALWTLPAWQKAQRSVSSPPAVGWPPTSASPFPIPYFFTAGTPFCLWLLLLSSWDGQLAVLLCDAVTLGKSFTFQSPA